VLSWDRIDGDPARADGEILALYIVGSAVRESAAYAVAARGSTGATTAYYAGLEPSADTIRIGKVVAGVNTSLASAALSLPAPSAGANPASSAFWIRFRFQGTSAFAHGLGGRHVEPSRHRLRRRRRDRGRRLLRPLELGREHAREHGTSSRAARALAWSRGPITETEYDAWLRAPESERCAIAEFSATGFSPASADYTKVVPFYLSNTGYVSHEQDTPSSRNYPAGMESCRRRRQELGLALRGRASAGLRAIPGQEQAPR
jgi:hypothetical protein